MCSPGQILYTADLCYNLSVLSVIGTVIYVFSQIVSIAIFKNRTGKIFLGIIIGLSIWELYLYTVTEVLGLFRCISVIFIIGIWLIYLLLLIVIIRYKRIQLPTDIHFIRDHLRGMSIKEKVLLIIIIVVMAVQFLFAVVTVPYNYDSMTYHLPRILMWIQNHSVSYYATSIIRQNVSPVLAEYNNLHWMLLWGSDQFANLVQYKAYLFNAVLIWAILDELGCRRVWKLISVLLYMTMSLTLAESISTQTDLFACGWLMCTIYLALVIRSKEHLSINREDVFDMFELAVSVGLTYLAKPNLCITSVIIIAWLLAQRALSKDSFLVLVKYVLFCGAVILVMVLPTWMRNLKMYGDILASDYMGMIAVGSSRPAYILLNIYTEKEKG